jgi:hypothetical protein
MIKKGDIVTITDTDNEGYEKYRGMDLRVTHVATKYMKSEEFFRRGIPDGYHPGYDPSSNSPLYDLETLSGERVPFSLYGWEVRRK